MTASKDLDGFDPKARLQALGIVLPEPAAPAANYAPFAEGGDTLYISGQLPIEDGALQYLGLVGGDDDIPRAHKAARLAGIQFLAQASAALNGDWRRLVRLVKLGGFVASGPDFFAQPAVIDGASDLMVAVLGSAGRHARFAVSVPSLPLNATVEIDAIFQIIPA